MSHGTDKDLRPRLKVAAKHVPVSRVDWDLPVRLFWGPS